MGHEHAKFEDDAKELSVGGEIGFRCSGIWTSRGDHRLAVEGRDHHLPVADGYRSKSAGAFAVGVPDHFDKGRVCRPSVKYKLHAFSRRNGSTTASAGKSPHSAPAPLPPLLRGFSAAHWFPERQAVCLRLPLSRQRRHKRRLRWLWMAC